MHRRPETDAELWCSGCGEMHPKSAFCKDRKSASGLNSVCREIVKTQNQRYHQKTKAVVNARRKRNRRLQKESPEWEIWLRKKLLTDARGRARRRGIEFALTIEDVEVPERCPVFDIQLVWNSVKRSHNSPSLDRIEATKGYVPGNVWVISWRANDIKNDATPAELRRVADAIEVRLGKKAAGRELDGVTWDEYPVGRA